MSSVYRASYLLTLLSGCGSLLLVTITHAQDALGIADRDLLAEREQLQQQLAELESTVGQYDPALIETLSSLADSSTPLRLYSEASTLLARSLQIQRLSLGLFTPKQIPLILAKMDADARSGDWETVNDSMDYLYWLLLGKIVSEGGELVDNLIRLSEFHLRGVINDTENLQAYHYQQASKITYQALAISEEFLQADDPRLVELHYSLIKQLYLQSAAVERADDTAYALRAVVPGSKWVTPRRIAQARYYRAGLRLLNDMRRIVALSREDPAESLAMVDLYTADWHLLFDKNEAEAAYKNASAGLRAADVDPNELKLLFATAEILPIPTFHGTVANALASNNSAQTRRQTENSNELGNYLYFQEWFQAMSVISFPVSAPPLGLTNQAQLSEVRLRFSLDSLNDVSRWAGGRYRTNMSVAAAFDVVEPEDNPDINMEYLDQRLRLLHFRPRLENGIALPFEGTLLYRAAIN